MRIERTGNPPASSSRQARSPRLRIPLGLALLAGAAFGGQVHAATCGVAAPTSLGKYAGALCFFDLGDYDDALASSASGQNFTMTLPTGGTFQFNLKRNAGAPTPGGPANGPMHAVSTPTWSGSALGNNNWYAGIPGKPVLYQTTSGSISVITFSNFVVVNPDATTSTSFDFIAVDGETTSAPSESFSLSTDGTAWSEIDRSGTNITYTGFGSQSISWRSPGGNASAPVLLSRSPTQIVATVVGGGLQGIAFAIAATSITVAKKIDDPYGTGLGRIGAGDQFDLAITNSGGSTFDVRGRTSTSGNASGVQPVQAQSLVYFNGPVTVGETMAAGSSSALASYRPTTTCTSTSGATSGLPTAVQGGSVTLTTIDPASFDLIRCTITNTIPQPQVSIQKSVDTTTLPPGGAIAYTVTVTNTGPVSAAGTVVDDPVPAGIDAFDWTCTASGGAVCPNASGSGAIHETLATFPPGGRVVYLVHATVNANPPARVTNTGSANPPHGACFPDHSAPPCTATVSNPPAPIISITKTTSSTQAISGSTVTYAVRVRNAGSVAADGTVLDDAIPAGLTAPFSWTCAATGGAICPNASGTGALHETLATFPAGGEFTYTITATVDADPPASVLNRATAMPPPDGVCADASSPPCAAAVALPAAPRITIDKSADTSDALTPGGSVTYTVTVGNGGPVDAAGTRVQDEFPAGIASATWTCVASGGAVCPAADSGGTIEPPAPLLDQTLATFPPGSSLTWTIVAAVNPTPPAQVFNTAQATPPEGGLCLPAVAPGPCTATVANPSGPIVDIAKSADVSVLIPGGQVTWTVTARNSGIVPADGTTLDDPLPAGITGATWTCAASGGAVCPSANGSGALAAVVATFPVGSTLVYTIVADVDANPHAATVTNTATISPPPGGLCNGTGAAPCSASVTLPLAPRIAIAKSVAPSVAEPGGPLTWTVTVTNAGPVDASGTLVGDPLPDGVDPGSVGWTCAASNGALCPDTSGSGALAESLATFPPGGIVVYTITATVSATPPLSILNTAIATPPVDGRCAPGNTLPPCKATTTTPTVAQVRLNKSVADASGDGIAEPGETLTWTITLHNDGGSDATGYGVSDPLDAHTVFVSASDGGTLAGGTVTWTGLTVPAGGTKVLTVVVTVVDPIPAGVTQIANLAFHTGDTPPDCTAVPRPQGCAEIPVVGAVGITKSVADGNGDGIAEPGETLTWTITLRNTGGSDASGYGVSDPLDPHTIFVSASDGGTLAAGTVTWSGLTVPAGGTKVLSVVVTVVDPIPAGVTRIANLAFRTGDTPPDCEATPRPPSCAEIPVVEPTAAVVAIAKSASTDSLMANGHVVYTVTARNTGTTPATNVLVGDAIPAGIASFSWTCAASGGATCPAANGSGALSETIASLPVGAQVAYTIDAVVVASPPERIVNVAGVSLANGSCAPCSASVEGTVQVGPPAEAKPVPAADRWALCLMAALLALAVSAQSLRRRR